MQTTFEKLGGTYRQEGDYLLPNVEGAESLAIGVWGSDCETVLDQLYQAYAESHESDPTEIGEGFKELEEFLCTLPLEDNNAVFNLCCHLCVEHPS